MSDLYDRLRVVLPDAEFGPPATEQEIARVERALGMQFPDWLRQLYRRCNGIAGHEFNVPYLLPLDIASTEPLSLLGWNQSFRSACDQLRDAYESDGNLAAWEKSHARNYLIIGFDNGTNWAIDIKIGRAQILWYDERDPDADYSVLGQDLADACEKNEAQYREIHNRLYRGRQALRREDAAAPPTCDVEFIVDLLIELGRGSRSVPISIRESKHPSWMLYQRLKANPDEAGMLYVLEANNLELSLATRDGNLPFVLRAKMDWMQEPLRCLVSELQAAVSRIVLVIELARDRGAAKGERDRLGEHARFVFEQPQWLTDPDLEAIADYLFARDARRLEEDNRLGS